jgi:hypothetical protein
MKKFLLSAALLCGLSTVSHADWSDTSISLSSTTFSADTLMSLSGAYPGARLVGVVVGKASSGATLTIFDSNAVLSSTISVVDCGTIQAPKFDITVSSGITYTTSGTLTNGVTIIWRRASPPAR